MSTQDTPRNRSASWSVPGWLAPLTWLVVAGVFAIEIANSPHALLAGGWCGDGELLAAASILGHCPACYGFAIALLMAAASFLVQDQPAALTGAAAADAD